LVLLEEDREVANSTHIMLGGPHSQILLLQHVLLLEHLRVRHVHRLVLERHLVLTDEEAVMMVVLVALAPVDVLHLEEVRLLWLGKVLLELLLLFGILCLLPLRLLIILCLLGLKSNWLLRHGSSTFIFGDLAG